MKNPHNFDLFIRVFPQLSERDQIRLLSILTSPGKVRSAFKRMKDEDSAAQHARKFFGRLVAEVFNP